MTITEFITARLDEWEATARAASGERWSFGSVSSVAGGTLYDETRRIADLTYEHREDHDGSVVRHLLSDEADANGAHIAANDPAHVLATIAAHRAIVDQLVRHERLVEANIEATTEATRGGLDNQEQIAALRTHGWELRGRLDALRMAVDALAAIWADHDDYDEGWKP